MPDMSALTAHLRPRLQTLPTHHQTTGQSQHVQTLVLLTNRILRVNLGAVDVPALDRSFHLRRKRSSVVDASIRPISPPSIIIAFESRRRSSSTRASRASPQSSRTLDLFAFSSDSHFFAARAAFRGKLQVEDLLLELSIAAPRPNRLENRPISALSSRACRVSRSCTERASRRTRTNASARRGGRQRKMEKLQATHTVHSAPVILTVSFHNRAHASRLYAKSFALVISCTPGFRRRSAPPRTRRSRFAGIKSERDLSLAPCSGVIKRPMRFICG